MADPSVAQWVRKVRLVGRSQNYAEDLREHRDNIEQDIDQWFYRFPEDLNAQFSSLRVFELVNFAQASPRLEDREGFAHWISTLKGIDNVSTLNMLRCETSANNLTALVRALPRLEHVDLFDVDFMHPNLNVFTPANEGPSVALPGSPPTFYAELWPPTDPTAETIVKLPLLYPPPSLRSFRLDNTNSNYYSNLDHFRDWLRAETLPHCLESLELCGSTDGIPLRNFISGLGEASVLTHIQVPIGFDHLDGMSRNSTND